MLKYKVSKCVLAHNPEEPLAHYRFHVADERPGAWMLDVFACEDHSYLSPPDTDVNTLCWTGKEFIPWYIFGEKDRNLYGMSFAIEEILARGRRKEAVAMVGEWDSEVEEWTEEARERVMKLEEQGWKILNAYREQ